MVKRRAVMSVDDHMMSRKRRHDWNTEDDAAHVLQSVMFFADANEESDQVSELDKVDSAATDISDFVSRMIHAKCPNLKSSAFRSILEGCTSLVRDGLTNEVSHVVADRSTNIFTLPKIVRERIYELVLADEKEMFCIQALSMPIWNLDREGSTNWSGEKKHTHRGRRSSYAVPALLQVSHKIRSEAARSFFGDRTFVAYVSHIDFPCVARSDAASVVDDTSLPSPVQSDDEGHGPRANVNRSDPLQRIVDWFESIGPRNAALIKHFYIRFPEVNLYYPERLKAQSARKSAPAKGWVQRTIRAVKLHARVEKAIRHLDLSQRGLRKASLQLFFGWPGKSGRDQGLRYYRPFKKVFRHTAPAWIKLDLDSDELSRAQDGSDVELDISSDSDREQRAYR